MTEQRSFDLDATAHENDPISQIRANVTEPGMTEAEIEALVQDALDQTGGKPNRNGAGPFQAKPCQCERPLQMPNAWVPVATCAKCGRLPRGGS